GLRRVAAGQWQCPDFRGVGTAILAISPVFHLLLPMSNVRRILKERERCGLGRTSDQFSVTRKANSTKRKSPVARQSFPVFRIGFWGDQSKGNQRA
ncbi:MAG: hypothetical protein WCA44_18645, partial [Acidobacteriaceae bacterium]